MVHELKPMKVKRTVISPAAQLAIINRMKDGPFRAFELSVVAARQGYSEPFDLPDRITDRMIQRQKKLGNIELIKGSFRWQWVGQSNAA